MFWKKDIVGKIGTIIAEGTEVKGDITSEGTVRVDGSVSGHIWKSKGVIVGKTGKIGGDLQSETVIIGGEIRGNVVASNTLELLSTATIFGNVEAKTLSIQEGAVFQGKCVMKGANEKSEL